MISARFLVISYRLKKQSKNRSVLWDLLTDARLTYTGLEIKLFGGVPTGHSHTKFLGARPKL